MPRSGPKKIGGANADNPGDVDIEHDHPLLISGRNVSRYRPYKLSLKTDNHGSLESQTQMDFQHRGSRPITRLRK
jgi:hypothetical protein